MRKVEFWLVSTEHLEDRLLFRDVEDFTVGMNIVAVQANKRHVKVLAFILMSNHLHFVLLCTREEAEAFVNGFKLEFSRFLHKKYGCSEHLRRNGVDIRLIPQENEALERALAGFSARERFRLLHSKADVPGTWVMSDAGYVLPSSYVRKDLVEGVFRSPMRMNYFLRSSSKARLRLEIGEQSLPAFKDQVMAAALPDLCWSLYRKGTVGELSEEQLVELLRQLRFRFSASVSQVARVTGLSYERVAAFLDRV